MEDTEVPQRSSNNPVEHRKPEWPPTEQKTTPCHHHPIPWSGSTQNQKESFLQGKYKQEDSRVPGLKWCPVSWGKQNLGHSVKTNTLYLSWAVPWIPGNPTTTLVMCSLHHWRLLKSSQAVRATERAAWKTDSCNLSRGGANTMPYPQRSIELLHYAIV
jgi:hypothetical protein